MHHALVMIQGSSQITIDNMIEFVDAETRQVCLDVFPQVRTQYAFVDFSKDGKWFLVYQVDAGYKLYRILDRSLVGIVNGHGDYLLKARISENSQFIYAFYKTATNNIYFLILNISDLSIHFECEFSSQTDMRYWVTEKTLNIAESPEGHWLFIYTDQETTLMFDLYQQLFIDFPNPFADFVSGNNLRPGVRDAKFSPNGYYLALVPSGEFENNNNTQPFVLLNTRTWLPILEMEFLNLNVNRYGFVNALEFSPDSRYLVLAVYIYITPIDNNSLGEYRGPYMIDLHEFTIIELEPARESQLAIAFHPDSQRMAIVLDYYGNRNASVVVYDLVDRSIIGEISAVIRDEYNRISSFNNNLVGVSKVTYSRDPILYSIDGQCFDEQRQAAQRTIVVIDETDEQTQRVHTTGNNGLYSFAFIEAKKKSLLFLEPTTTVNDTLLSHVKPL